MTAEEKKTFLADKKKHAAAHEQMDKMVSKSSEAVGLMNSQMARALSGMDHTHPKHPLSKTQIKAEVDALVAKKKKKAETAAAARTRARARAHGHDKAAAAVLVA